MRNGYIPKNKTEEMVVEVAEYYEEDELDFIVGEWVQSKYDIEIDGAYWKVGETAQVFIKYHKEFMGVPINSYWVGLRHHKDPNHVIFSKNLEEYFESIDKKEAGYHQGTNGQRVLVVGSGFSQSLKK